LNGVVTSIFSARLSHTDICAAFPLEAHSHILRAGRTRIWQLQHLQCSRIKPTSRKMVDVKPWCISHVEPMLCGTAIWRLRLVSCWIGSIIPVRNRWVAVPHAVTALVSLLLRTYFGSASRQILDRSWIDNMKLLTGWSSTCLQYS
jgi:hypothetical protein